MFQDLKPRFSLGLPLASFVFSIHPSSFAFSKTMPRDCHVTCVPKIT